MEEHEEGIDFDDFLNSRLDDVNQTEGDTATAGNKMPASADDEIDDLEIEDGEVAEQQSQQQIKSDSEAPAEQSAETSDLSQSELKSVQQLSDSLSVHQQGNEVVVDFWSEADNVAASTSVSGPTPQSNKTKYQQTWGEREAVESKLTVIAGAVLAKYRNVIDVPDLQTPAALAKQAEDSSLEGMTDSMKRKVVLVESIVGQLCTLLTKAVKKNVAYRKHIIALDKTLEDQNKALMQQKEETRELEKKLAQLNEQLLNERYKHAKETEIYAKRLQQYEKQQPTTTASTSSESSAATNKQQATDSTAAAADGYLGKFLGGWGSKLMTTYNTAAATAVQAVNSSSVTASLINSLSINSPPPAEEPQLAQQNPQQPIKKKKKRVPKPQPADTDASAANDVAPSSSQTANTTAKAVANSDLPPLPLLPGSITDEQQSQQYVAANAPSEQQNDVTLNF